MEWENKARAALSAEGLAALKEKATARMPGVIVPGAVKAVNVTDKDGNGVYRLVAYAA